MRSRAAEDWYRAMKYDQKAAKVLLENNSLKYTVFLSVQMIEKGLKSVWLEKKEGYPPRTHNLVKLARGLGVWEELGKERQKFLAFLSPLYIAIRYPDVHDDLEDTLDRAEAEDIFATAEEVCSWLESKLK